MLVMSTPIVGPKSVDDPVTVLKLCDAVRNSMSRPPKTRTPTGFFLGGGGRRAGCEDGVGRVCDSLCARTSDGAMSVAAVGKFMDRAWYSSTGSYTEIAAPGGDDRTGSGLDGGFVWQVTLDFDDQDPSLPIPRFDRYLLIGYEGTSMATPHVSGLAALLMSQGVTSPAAIESLIRKTARDLGPAGKDDSFGYGLIQPRPSLFGFGIIK